MRDGLEVMWTHGGAAMGLRHNLTIFVLRDPLTLEHVRRLRRATGPVFARFADKRATLIVVEPSAVADVAKEVREAAADQIRSFPTTVAATVIEGTGFRAVAGRAIVAGILLLSQSRSTTKVFDGVDDAARWMAVRVPVPQGVPWISTRRRLSRRWGRCGRCWRGRRDSGAPL